MKIKILFSLLLFSSSLYASQDDSYYVPLKELHERQKLRNQEINAHLNRPKVSPDNKKNECKYVQQPQQLHITHKVLLATQLHKRAIFHPSMSWQENQRIKSEENEGLRLICRTDQGSFLFLETGGIAAQIKDKKFLQQINILDCSQERSACKRAMEINIIDKIQGKILDHKHVGRKAAFLLQSGQLIIASTQNNNDEVTIIVSDHYEKEALEKEMVGLKKEIIAGKIKIVLSAASIFLLAKTTKFFGPYASSTLGLGAILGLLYIKLSQ